MIQQFFQEQDGQALVEYGLLIALVALAVVSAITVFGNKIKANLYQKAISQMSY